MSQKPAFEVRDAAGNPLCRIWANGRSEGLPSGCVINRIPALIALARQEGARNDNDPGRPVPHHGSGP